MNVIYRTIDIKFDIKSLFPYIPLDKTIDIITNKCFLSFLAPFQYGVSFKTGNKLSVLEISALSW